MFKLKREAWPISLVLMGAVLAMTLSLSLAVPKAGAVTIAELMAQIQALQAQLTILQGGTTSGTATACTFTRSLYLGVSDPQVKCLQQYLNAAGFTLSASGAGSVGNETNYYGTRTQSAVVRWQAANNVLPAVGYFGPISRAKYNSLVIAQGSSTSPLPVPQVVNIAKLTADNPASSHVTNNASNFKMLEVAFEGSGTVNSLTVKRLSQTTSGFGKATDFGNGIYLYKDGVKVADKKWFSGTDNTVVTFSNLNLKAPFKLAVMVDFSGVSGNVAKIELSGDYADLPLSSNDFTFANMNSGTFDLVKVGTLDSVSVGQRQALVSEFKVIASSAEAVGVKHIELYNQGHNVLSNVKITDGSNTWSGFIRDNKIIFDLDTLVKASKSKTFKVYADVDGSVGNEIKLSLQNQYDVIVIGDTYKFGATMNNPNTFNTDNQDLTLVGSGELTVKTKSGLDVQAMTWGSSDKKVLGFTIKSENEPFDITSLSFKLNNLDEVVKSLSVFQGSTRLGQETADNIATSTVDTSFVLSGEKTFWVYADLNDIDKVASSTFSVNLVKIEATGINSNKDISIYPTNVVGKKVYVYPSVVSIQSTVNSGIFTNSQNKKVFGFKLTAVGGDVKIAANSPFVKLSISEQGLKIIAAHDEITLTTSTVVSSVLNMSSTGAGGWSCPADYPKVISYYLLRDGSKPIAHEGIFKPDTSVGSYTWPNAVGYTYGIGEEGVLVINGNIPQAVTINLVCGKQVQTTIPATYSTVPYVLKHGSDIIASGNITGSGDITINTNSNENSVIEITEGNYAEFILYADLTGFTGDDEYFGVVMDDVSDAIKWVSKDSEDEWLTTQFGSVIDTIIGLPIDSVEFN